MMRWRYAHSLGLGVLIGLALTHHGLVTFGLGVLVGAFAFFVLLNVQRLVRWLGDLRARRRVW